MIRKLTQEEYNNAADLSYQVYMECGRNDFTQEGIETFKSFVYDTSLMNTLDIYGAFDNHLLIGIIGGKSSVSCPLKPSDSTPLKHSTMPP